MVSLFRRSKPQQQIAATTDLPVVTPAEPIHATSVREQELERSLAAIAAYFEDDRDLTLRLELNSPDPAVQRVEARLNHFREKVRIMRLQLEELTVQTSTGAASSGHQMRVTAGKMDEARHELEMAVSGISQGQTGVSEVARAASNAAALASEAEQATTGGAAVIQDAIDSVSGIQQGIALAEERVNALVGHSEQIGKVSAVIDSIAQRTNLLALNAAIEAARAGQHGRGFAVVADEVRKLAEGTAAQTREIRNLITAVVADLTQTGQVIREGKARADEGVARASQAGEALKRLQSLVRQSAEPLTEIAALAEEQSAALEQVTASLGEVSQRVSAVAETTASVAEVTSGLAGGTEKAFSSLMEFNCGSMVDNAAAAAYRVAADVRQYLEKAIDARRFSLDDLLSFQYHEYKGQYVDRLKTLMGDISRAPRDGFTPPKYGTNYDYLVDVDLRDMLDQHLEAANHVGFIVLSDLNGYAPAQNSRYCQPWTGDFKKDVHSRVKRLNCDPAQVRGSRMGFEWNEREPLGTGEADVRNLRTVHSRREFLAAGIDLKEPAGGDHRVLLQTFTRHTGTVVNVLSVPLYIKGQRYGGIIVGWVPQRVAK